MSEYIPRENIRQFREKLTKWMFHNSEDVRGDRMVDVDYLEAAIDEIFIECGITEFDEEGNLIE